MSRFKLSEDKIALAKKLRRDGVSWPKIGNAVGLSERAVRRIVDKGYAKRMAQKAYAGYRRRQRQLQDLRIATQAADKQEECVLTDGRKADERFQSAMRRAISKGIESAPLGIDMRPCTREARFVPAQSTSSGSTGSPAGMCADA